MTQRSMQKKSGCFWAEDRLMDEGNAPVNIHGPRDQEVYLEACALCLSVRPSVFTFKACAY